MLDFYTFLVYITCRHEKVFLLYNNFHRGGIMAKKNDKKETRVEREKEKLVEVKEKDTKESLWSKFMTYCHGVKVEAKRIHWTNKKDLAKYTGATLLFVVLFSLFFYLVNALFALLHSVL